jgi:hypothetical protein
MPYRGAKLYSENYLFDYKFTELSNGRVLKHPYIVYPKDPEVHTLMLLFKERMNDYLEAFKKEKGHGHFSKDHTGAVYVKLLGDLLKEYKRI